MSRVNMFITGQNGFIGREILSDIRFTTRIKSLSSDCKYSHLTRWDEHLKDVDVVVHLASLAHSTSYSQQDLQDVNVKLPCELYKSCEDNNVKRFIYISTTSVYGHVSELSDYSTKSPSSILATSRWKAEEELLILSESSSVELVILNCPLVYSLFSPANFGSLVRVIKKLPVLPFLSLKAKKNMISLYNLVDVIFIFVIYEAKLNKKEYLVCENEIRLCDLVKEMSFVFNKNKRAFSFPLVSLIKFIPFFKT